MEIKLNTKDEAFGRQLYNFINNLDKCDTMTMTPESAPPEPYKPLGELEYAHYEPEALADINNGDMVIAESNSKKEIDKGLLRQLHHDYTCYMAYRKWRVKWMTGKIMLDLPCDALDELDAIDTKLQAGPGKPCK